VTPRVGLRLTLLRNMTIQVPDTTEKELPVLIALHGRTGNGRGAVNMILKHHPDIAAKFIVVGLTGYRNCWNVCGEDSKVSTRVGRC